MADDYFDYAVYESDHVDASDSWGDLDIGELLEGSQERHKERLEQELAQIERQLEERDRIHCELVEELEWKIERYTDRLEHLYRIGKGRLDGSRDQLKDRIISFYQELRDEQREHWQDRQQLEQERRDVLRELDEAQKDTFSDLL